MSVWTTKALERDANYIVMKHKLRGFNGNICGVKFRDSYGVVEKDSKTYRTLKSTMMLRNAPEYPLTFLIRLPFITRSADIQHVYGRDVYSKYRLALIKEAEAAEQAKVEQAKEVERKRQEELAAKVELEKQLEEAKQAEDEEKVAEIVEAMPEITKCAFQTPDGKLCKNDAFEHSPSGYCKLHLLQDPKLEELGIKVPMAMTKSERRKFKATLYKKLAELKSEGAF